MMMRKMGIITQFATLTLSLTHQEFVLKHFTKYSLQHLTMPHMSELVITNDYPNGMLLSV